MPTVNRHRLAPLACLLLPLAAGACTRDDGDTSAYSAAADPSLTRRAIPSFAEWKRSSFVKSLEGGLFMVDWDIPIRGEETLRRYYDSLVARTTPKSAVRQAPLTNPDPLHCFWHQGDADCIDDIWYGGSQRGLRYCVSTGFGARYAEMVAGMAAATQAWQEVTNVWFQYDPTNDAACGQDSPLPAGLTFKVAPWSGEPGCAFFPYSGYYGHCAASTLLFNLALDVTPFTVAALATHEVGHMLGLYHEHGRYDAPSALSCHGGDVRPQTEVDTQSIMGYPLEFGGCALGAGLRPSALDGWGIRLLYKAPPQWLVSTSPVLM